MVDHGLKPVILCLSVWGTPQPFSLAAASLYIPISNAWSIYIREDVIIFVYVKPPLHCKDNSNLVIYMFFRSNCFIVLMASVIDLPPGCSIHYWKGSIEVSVIKELFLPSVVNFPSYIWALLLGAYIFIIVIYSGWIESFSLVSFFT